MVKMTVVILELSGPKASIHLTGLDLLCPKCDLCIVTGCRQLASVTRLFSAIFKAMTKRFSFDYESLPLVAGLLPR